MAQVRISCPMISFYLISFEWRVGVPFLRRIDKEIQWSLAFHPAFLVFSSPFSGVAGGVLNALVALFFAVVTQVRQLEWIYKSLTCFQWDSTSPSAETHGQDEIIIFHIVCLLLSSAHDDELVPEKRCDVKIVFAGYENKQPLSIARPWRTCS